MQNLICKKESLDIASKIKKTVRDINDFPKAGIVFKDITPLLLDHQLTAEISEALYAATKHLKVDAVMGIESRGFLWGVLLAQQLKVPFIPLRKKGKLPYKTISHQYALEYGTAEVEVHEDAIKAGDNILIHDDLLATGGTAEAAAYIVEKQKASVAGFSFIVTLDFLKGREKLKAYANHIDSLVSY